MRKIFFERPFRLVFIPIAAAGFLALISYVVMQLWNNLMPVIFHLGVINFWQALGLFILSKILFGFGKGKSFGGGGAPWMRKHMEDRFKNMTPEEKLKFKQKMEERCGWGSPRGRRHSAGWDAFTEEKPEATE